MRLRAESIVLLPAVLGIGLTSCGGSSSGSSGNPAAPSIVTQPSNQAHADGGASRMDFLLKNEKLVVEAKMTRAALTEKQIGEQLIVDAAGYSTHPDCTILVCFIYDPEAT